MKIEPCRLKRNDTILLILTFSSRDSLTKSVQLSPKPATLSQSQPTNNSIIKRHPVVTNRRVVTQPQPKLPQAAAPVQQQQGQKSMVTGQAAQAQPLRVVASGGARPGQTTTRTVIIGAQLQNIVALGQKIVMRGPGCMEGWSLVNPMWEIWVNLGLWPTGCTRYEDSDERPGCTEGWSLVNSMWEIWVNLGLWPTRYELTLNRFFGVVRLRNREPCQLSRKVTLLKQLEEFLSPPTPF